MDNFFLTRLYSKALPAKDRNAVGYLSLVLHTLTLIWHIVWFAIGVTVALWVEILPNFWTTVLNYTLRPLNILVAILSYGVLILSTAAIVAHRPSFPQSWIKQLLFALYLATALTLAIYDGDIFDVGIRQAVGRESHMCIVTMNTYATLVGLPLSIIMSVLWLFLVSSIGEGSGIKLPEEEAEEEV